MITNQRRLRVLTAASGLVALAFLGTACGGDGDNDKTDASTAGSNGAPSMDQQLKLAKCMRGNGIDMPDPKPGEDPRGITIGGQGASREKIEKAMKTCREAAGIPAPKPISQEQKDKMLKFAKCMRQHGVDMPDPKFDGGSGSGRAVKIPESGAEKEKFDKANKACGSAFG